ncbi:MAG: hypothetical protein MUP17_00030 [candidate division Zixibacteria bacterium]|nr:hypothetical protein [candidate division Zixibacteria bacterium]
MTIDITLFLTIFFGVSTIVLSIILYIKSKQSVIKQTLNAILHVYSNRFTSDSSQVSDLFNEGVQLIKKQNWDMAIAKFEEAKKQDPTAGQLIAIYSFIGQCKYYKDDLKLAIENWNKSFNLAKDVGDEDGERAALGYLSLIVRPKEELPKI